MSNPEIKQKRKLNVAALAETAILVAVAFGLSWIKFDIVPYGGAITVASMLPILLIGIRRGLPWGVGGALVYSLLQALQGGSIVPPATGLWQYFLMMLLDYVLAFGVLSLSALFRKMKYGLAVASPVCLLLRYFLHVVSGVVLWASYAWEGWGAAAYSFAYNATYMGPEIVITTAAAILFVKALPKYSTKVG